MNEYEKQANDFLNATKTELTIDFLRHGKHFDDDTNTRDIYKITLNRGSRGYTFNFGQSLDKSLNPDNWRQSNPYNKKLKKVKPTNYDVLACLNGYSPGTFEYFCDDYGYDTDSIKARKTYDAIVDEWFNLEAMYSPDELDMLGGIQ
jgi:hypothetical protein